MNYISTRNKYNISDNNFSKITMEGLAPDGGLYVPDNFPFLTSKEIYKMANLSYSELFTEIIYKFCGSCVNKSEIYEIAKDFKFDKSEQKKLYFWDNFKKKS